MVQLYRFYLLINRTKHTSRDVSPWGQPTFKGTLFGTERTTSNTVVY